jgi:hypothetical protein
MESAWWNCGGLALALIAPALCAAAGAEGETSKWLTGAEFGDRLEAKVGVKWVDNPLRQGLANLSRSQGVAIFLDRRVDPGKRVSLSAEDEPLESILARIAAEVGLETCRIDCVVYVGPKPTAARLATLSMLRKDEARKLPPAVMKRLAERKPLAWEMLATPRELVEQTVASIPAKAPDLAFFPHDLWPAGELPALSAIDRLTLLLAGFDLTFELVARMPENAGRRSQPELFVRLIDMPADVLARREYKPRGDVAKAAERLTSLFPSAQISVAKGKLEVLATAEVHESIERALSGQAPPKRTAPAVGNAAPEKRYTLKTPQQPLGPLAKALAKQLGLEAAFDPSAETKLHELVAIEVRDATLDELLDALVKPAGLAYEIEGKTLRIKAP